jgi:hypothetical protein
MSVLEDPVFGLSASAVVESEGEELIYTLSQRIVFNLQTLAKSKPALSQEVEKTKTKFQKWCNTLGANIRGVYSLDERLRDASAVKRYIVNCLGDIAEALEETQAVSRKPEGNAFPSTHSCYAFFCIRLSRYFFLLHLYIRS